MTARWLLRLTGIGIMVLILARIDLPALGRVLGRADPGPALAAARVSGARYVSIDNLYGYDASTGPISEDTRVAPASTETRARTDGGRTESRYAWSWDSNHSRQGRETTRAPCPSASRPGPR